MRWECSDSSASTAMDLRSIASRHSLSESSVYTTTSSSTQWGPGALAGKGILAIGKAVVRSAEYLVITRRLSAIKAVLPCSDKDDGDGETMFNDLLELSRYVLRPMHASAEVLLCLSETWAVPRKVSNTSHAADCHPDCQKGNVPSPAQHLKVGNRP
jgi:hypothetical protein